MEIDSILRESKVLICAGTGGVGKTTCAAALALRAGELGLKTLVLTVDPAKRLATSLGMDLSSDQEVLIPGCHHVWAAIIDSEKTFHNFVKESALSEESAERLLRNPLYIQLSTTLSGSQEFTALERVYNACENNKFDLIVLDTPPSQHALDFLTAPQKIRDLFQDSVTKWFGRANNLGAGRAAGWISRGTTRAFNILERLTGAYFIQDLKDFFTNIRAFQKSLQDHSARVQQILHSSTTRFILVTSFDQSKLNEAQDFISELRDFGYHFAVIIINRAFPDWLDLSSSADAARELTELSRSLAAYYEKLCEYFARKAKMYDNFLNALTPGMLMLKVPELSHDVTGLDDLTAVYRSMRK